MNKIFILSVLLIFAAAAFPQEKSGAEYCALKKQHQALFKPTEENSSVIHSYDVQNYTLSFDLYANFLPPYPGSFSAYEVITFRVDSVLNSISLNASGTTLEVDSVGMDAASFTHEGDILRINLNQVFNPGSTGNVKIYFRHKNILDPHFNVDSGFVFTDNEPQGARNWFPCWDDPSDKATVNIIAKVPSTVKLGSNGRLADSTKIGDTIYYNWISRDPVSTYLVVITGKVNYNLDIVQYQGNNSSFPIRFYWNEGDDINTIHDLENKIVNITAFYEQLYTKHPFEKNGFASVSNAFMWGGMENQTLTTLCPDCWTENLIVHEYAHQWFGDMITCATWADIWLNEGFATYNEILWAEHNGGYHAYKEGVNWRAESYLQNNPGWAISNPEWAVNPPDLGVLFNYYITYLKGAIALHLLRYSLGDSTFFNVMKTYANDPGLKYKNATVRDFNGVVNSVTGEDYNWFFDEWIFSPNHPDYKNQYFITDLGNGNWRVGFKAIQNPGNNVFFKMPLEILIGFTSGADTLIRVMNNQNNQLFTFDFNRQPHAVEFDPGNQIVIKTASLTHVLDGNDGTGIPEKYLLRQNYPNPFNPVTNIKFEIPAEGNVNLSVYNSIGQKISTVINQFMTAGKYEVNFDASEIPSGIYFYRLEINNFTSVKKMIVLK